MPSFPARATDLPDHAIGLNHPARFFLQFHPDKSLPIRGIPDLSQRSPGFISSLQPAGNRGLREPRAYLTAIAKRLMLNHHRRRALDQAYLDALAVMPPALAPSVEQRLLILEALHEIDEMLSGLPGPVREAFCWRSSKA